jgi:hypothetical protein
LPCSPWIMFPEFLDPVSGGQFTGPPLCVQSPAGCIQLLIVRDVIRGKGSRPNSFYSRLLSATFRAVVMQRISVLVPTFVCSAFGPGVRQIRRSHLGHVQRRVFLLVSRVSCAGRIAVASNYTLRFMVMAPPLNEPCGPWHARFSLPFRWDSLIWHSGIALRWGTPRASCQVCQITFGPPLGRTSARPATSPRILGRTGKPRAREPLSERPVFRTPFYLEKLDQAVAVIF